MGIKSLVVKTSDRKKVKVKRTSIHQKGPRVHRTDVNPELDKISDRV